MSEKNSWKDEASVMKGFWLKMGPEGERSILELDSDSCSLPKMGTEKQEEAESRRVPLVLPLSRPLT